MVKVPDKPRFQAGRPPFARERWPPMPMHDIFICYSSQDEDKARGVLTRLEARGFKCWISSRDVAPGRNYQEDIVRAIEEAKVILFLFSEASNKTSEVKKELSLASS